MKRAILAVGVLLLAGAAQAVEQDNKLEPPALENYRRWGLLRARPGFELSHLGYDSNILANSSGELVGDFTATLSPRMDGLILFGSKAFVTLSDQFDYTLYLENHEQNFWNNEFVARGTVPFGSVGLFAEVAIDDLQLRPVDQEDIRTDSQRRSLGSGVILRPGWRTEIELARYDDRWRYKDVENQTVPERLNREEALTDLDISYQLRGRTRALLQLQKKDIQFDFPYDTGTSLIERDTKEWRALTGVRLGRGGSLVGTLLLGYGSIDAQDPVLEDLSAMIGELDATWLAGARTRVRLRAYRTPGFAVSEGNAYYLDTSGAARVVHYFTNLLGGELAYRRGRLDFPVAQSGVTRQDISQHVEIGARMRIFSGADGRRVEYSLTVGRYRRDSNVPGYDQERNTFGFGAVLGF